MGWTIRPRASTKAPGSADRRPHRGPEESDPEEEAEDRPPARRAQGEGTPAEGARVRAQTRPRRQAALIRDLEIRLAPERIEDPAALAEAVARQLGVPAARVTQVAVERRSIDARRRPPAYVLRVDAWVDEAPAPAPAWRLRLRDVRDAEPVVIVGAGPAGLFAALRLIEGGLRPIVLERGKDVRGRRLDVARLNREGIVDPESNYCFGEGGAGTFSDGKLYTRSTKRGEVRRVLRILVQLGAPPDILVDAHPHIGTNRLPRVVQALRETIVAHGAAVRFGSRVDDLVVAGGRIVGVTTAGGERIDGRGVVLATGHSARDVYAMLRRRGIGLEPKPFALGVRVEHPQALIDRIQYHCASRPVGLPAAAYSVVRRVEGRSVYSFCMCPGGVICPATTAPDEVVVNGWSPSRRTSRFANAGVVVETTLDDLRAFGGDDVLAGMELQAAVERAAAAAGGGRCVAPAQRLVDFVEGRAADDLPGCSYVPGLQAVELAAVLPPPVTQALRVAFRAFGGMLRGYLTNDAVVVGVETRTSAPVRIPRDPVTCMHPGAPGLFPCGEGAGAAGGIVSAAMDGERCAVAMLGGGGGASSGAGRGSARAGSRWSRRSGCPAS